MTVQVSASLLSASPLCYAKEVERAEKSCVDMLHIDVMDGHFVPNLTFGPGVLTPLKAHTFLPFDVHLMVDDADAFIHMYKDCADSITIHPESTKHLHRSLMLIKSFGKMVGVAINPGTSLMLLEPVLDMVDLVLIMSVNPGFGGQSFIEESLEKIANVKKMAQEKNHPVDISVDGGIHAQTAPRVIEAGANILVSGSYLFAQKDMSEAVLRLKQGIAS